MKSAIFFIVALVLGVSSLPSRVRRQFDWGKFENREPDTLDSDSDPSFRISRQDDQRRWGNQGRGFNTDFNGQGGRQFPVDNVFDQNFDTNTGNQGNNFIGNNGNQGGGNGVSSTTEGTTTTRAPASYVACMRQCRRTGQYNPVCGSDGNDYSNEFELRCAVGCGRAVQLRRPGTCNGL